MTAEQAKQQKFCEACGKSHKAYPQHHGEEHRCGPKDWAAYQNTMLKMILVAVSASPFTEADILTAQKLIKEHSEHEAEPDSTPPQTIGRTPEWRERLGYLPPCTRCGGMGVIFLNNEPHTVEHCPVCKGKGR